MFPYSIASMDTQTINFDTKSVLAKLIATENISVQHNKVKTASFDTKNRILTLPVFKQPKGDVYDMLIAHECAHALHTPFDGWKSIMNDDELRSYVNVLEDCRIDKMIQKQYPGVVKNYINGFDLLEKQDFFGTHGKDINKDYMLIDKINLYYKSSKRLPFIFSPKDVSWLGKVDKLKTFDDVVNLAKDLLQWQKKQVEQMKKLPDFDSHVIAENYNLNGHGELDDDVEVNFGDESNKSDEDKNKDADNKESNESESNNEDKKESGEQTAVNEEAQVGGGEGVAPNKLVSITNESLEDKKSNLYDGKKSYSYFTLPNTNLSKVIISNKQYLKDMRSYAFKEIKQYSMYGTYYNWLKTHYKQFKNDNKKTVNYLVKEFEMKKAATAYKRASTDKTGVIDPLKLPSYKYSDDIFKRLTILPDAKNHGMMMLLDWSGSMCNILKQTVEQLMNLVWFCQKVNIPYEVYLFTSEYGGDDRHTQTSGHFEYKYGDVMLDKVNLVCVANNKVKKTELDESLMWLYHMALAYDDRYSSSYFQKSYEGEMLYMPHNYYLGTTPLNQALIAFEKMIPMFKNKNKIEKMSLITLTDGGANFSFSSTSGDSGAEVPSGHGKPVIKVGKKQYTVADEGRYYSSDIYTGLLLDIIRQRHGISTIGFYVTKKLRGYDVERFARDCKNWEERYKATQKIKNSLSKEKYASVDSMGYDKYFLLNGKKLNVENTDLSGIKDNMKSSGIARVFKKSMKGRITSRTLLNQFIQEVA
jgi:hypothetical protein